MTNVRWFQPHQHAVRLSKSHACYTVSSGANCTTSEHAESWTVATSNIGGCNSDCSHLEQWTLRGLTSKCMIQHGRSTWTCSCDSCLDSSHFLFLLKDPSRKLQVSAFNRKDMRDYKDMKGPRRMSHGWCKTELFQWKHCSGSKPPCILTKKNSYDSYDHHGKLEFQVWGRRCWSSLHLGS